MEPQAPLNAVLYPEDPRCYHDNSGVVDDSITGGTTPYIFAWSTGYTGEDLVSIGGGTYTVSITDANGCPIQPPPTVLTEPDILTVAISFSGQILCYGDKSVMATANITSGTGSFSYLWDDPGAQITNPANLLGAGPITVEVTNEKGCSATASGIIPGPAAQLSVTAVLTNPSCPGMSDGSIVPTVTGGTPGFDYEWSNNVFERINANIDSGSYTLKITDDNNCALVQNFTLINPDTVKIVSADATDLTCSGRDDGSIAITAAGGTGTYTYSADGGAIFVTTSLISSLAEGDYIVVVKDGNNCLSEEFPITLNKSETCAMVIYDGFSPNGDEFNPVWNIGNVESFPNIVVKVFNVWGKMVFSSTGYASPWDGKYEGKDLPSGTYYYVIDPGDGSGNLTGAVNIVY